MQVVFQSVCTILAGRTLLLITVCCQHLLLVLFCGFAMVIGVWWYLTDAIQGEACFYVC